MTKDNGCIHIGGSPTIRLSLVVVVVSLSVLPKSLCVDIYINVRKIFKHRYTQVNRTQSRIWHFSSTTTTKKIKHHCKWHHIYLSTNTNDRQLVAELDYTPPFLPIRQFRLINTYRMNPTRPSVNNIRIFCCYCSADAVVVVRFLFDFMFNALIIPTKAISLQIGLSCRISFFLRRSYTSPPHCNDLFFFCYLFHFLQLQRMRQIEHTHFPNQTTFVKITICNACL